MQYPSLETQNIPSFSAAQHQQCGKVDNGGGQKNLYPLVPATVAQTGPAHGPWVLMAGPARAGRACCLFKVGDRATTEAQGQWCHAGLQPA
jgi:hypothetical protein